MDGMKGERKRGAASLMLSIPESLPEHMHEGVREITNVFVNPAHRNKGYASALMEQVCDEADESQIVLMLMPEPYQDSGRTKEQLLSWYESFGFSAIQDSPCVMARKPYTHESTN